LLCHDEWRTVGKGGESKAYGLAAGVLQFSHERCFVNRRWPRLAADVPSALNFLKLTI